MTMYESALSALASRLTGTDASLTTSLRDIVAAALQELIEAELTATIGAAAGERSPERVTRRSVSLAGPGRHRNGSYVHHVPVDWLGAQLCPCSLATGFDTMLPDAVQVADPFHVVRVRSRLLTSVGRPR